MLSLLINFNYICINLFYRYFIGIKEHNRLQSTAIPALQDQGQKWNQKISPVWELATLDNKNKEHKLWSIFIVKNNPNCLYVEKIC